VAAAALFTLSQAEPNITAKGGVKAAGTRAATWTVGNAQFADGNLNGLICEGATARLALATGTGEGSYVSAIHATEFAFNAIGSHWTADLPADSSLSVEVRASDDGLAWSAWIPVEPVGNRSGNGFLDAGEVVFAQGRYLQCRVTLRRGASGAAPTVDRLALTYIDTSQGPTVWEASASSGLRAATTGQPPLISRAAWGCPEPNSSVNWPPEYCPTLKIIVHHTVTSNNPPDPAAAVRAIYYYHATELGWGDIGYNFLIDQYGNVYEGRYGGDNVIGGHAAQYNPGSVGIALLGNFMTEWPTQAAQDALVKWCAWECSRHHIDPTGQGLFVDKNLANICGHRDAMPTACPGDTLYSLLPNIRSRTAAICTPPIPGYRELWITHNTPAVLAPGQTVSVSITLQNKGSLTWVKDGKYAYHLGYHWYRTDGTQFVQSPDDDKRTALPYDVAPEQSVTLNALLTAPREPGQYRLEWDMVREGYTWFKAEGNQPLNVNISVANPTLALDHNHLIFLADDSYSTGAQTVPVANAGAGTINWAASSNTNWCRLDAAFGAASYGAPSTMIVRVDRDVFRQTYGYDRWVTTQVTVGASSPDGPVVSSPQTISVSYLLSSQPLPHSVFPVIGRGAAGR